MNTVKVPFSVKAAIICVGVLALMTMLYEARNIIVPIIYATIFAIAMTPVVSFFEQKKISRVGAIALTILLVFVILVTTCVLLSSQMATFADSAPQLESKFYELLNSTITWASGMFQVSTTQIKSYISEAQTNMLHNSSSAIGATLSTVTNMVVVLTLIPVYIFMILFYQPILVEFIRRIFGTENIDQVNKILTASKTIIQKYLGALLIEAAIMAALNSIGLLAIGIQSAIIIGIIGAIINIIPYIGGIIAVLLPMLMALLTKPSPSYCLLVLGVYIIIQFIDNHYIIPKIVASKVRINALVSIIVILAGGALWGVPGMFLSIPLIAILKIICDQIEVLQPWGFLLGDTMPAMSIFKIKIKPKKPKVKVEQ